MIKLSLIMIFFCFSLNAEDKSLFSVLRKSLSPDIFWILENTPNRKQVINRLKGPDRRIGKKDLYAYNNFKYSLSLSYDEKDKIQILSYRTINTKLNLYDFLKVYKKQDFVPHPQEGKHAGRFIALTDEQTGVRIIFKNNSKRILYRVLYNGEWKK